jgi:precorrin-8X/cobalt-precorrin-8 methylmutase
MEGCHNLETIILIGHGSPRKDSNTLEAFATLLHKTIHPGCAGKCVKTAYMQFVQPDILSTIDTAVAEGTAEIVIHPFFLHSGIHVTKNIPEIIADAKKNYPLVKFIYTEPLGTHENLIKVILERISAAGFNTPLDIEKRCFEIIVNEEDLSDIPQKIQPIVTRVIHATADFEFKKTLIFHPDAVDKAIGAIKAGKNILTDVGMVRAGISKKILAPFGGSVLCGLISNDNEDESKKHGDFTRAEAGIEAALSGSNNIGIIAIGNAPTALLECIDFFNRKGKPDNFPVVIGVPVGFVNALESKVLLAKQPFPFITNLARKGGTPVAVAIVNALLKMSTEQ